MKHRFIVISLLLLSLTLTGVIWSMPRRSSVLTTNNKIIKYNFEKELANAKAKLPTAMQNILVDIEKQYQTSQSLNLLDTLAAFWDNAMQPHIASFYYLKKAQKAPNYNNWLLVAQRYLGLSEFSDNQEYKAFYIEQVIHACQEILKEKPDNVEASVLLGAAYVSEAKQPMKGIELLKSVIKKDTNNIEARIYLAKFSMETGQNDKAIEHLEKVLLINPNYNEAYFYIADVYAQNGNKQKALHYLNIYKTKLTDSLELAQIDNYISTITNH